MTGLSWWMLYRFTEATMPAHDPPAVWKRWPGIGGLPRIEYMPGAPASWIPGYGATASDGLPTLHVLPASTQSSKEG